ncbi:MAG: ATP-dependent Clp protease ATP-binding subunit [Patescibacteria group bacterium]
MAEIKFQICSSCQGSGMVNRRTCPGCFGNKSFYFIDNNFFYWQRPLNYLYIFVREVQATLNILINVFLVLMGLLTFVLLAVIFIKQARLDPYNLWHYFITPSIYNFWLWLTIAFDMYFYYRLTYPQLKEKNRQKKLISKNVFIKHNIADSLNNETSVLLDKAWLYAQRKNDFPVSVWHLLFVLLNDKDIRLILARLGLGAIQLQELIDANLSKSKAAASASGDISEELKDGILNAYWHMVSRHDQRLAEVDLLYGLTVASQSVRNFFFDFNIDEDKIDNVIAWLTINKQLSQDYMRHRSRAKFKPRGDINRAYTAIATPILDNFSEDLTGLARVGRLGLCVGRSKELADILETIQSNLSSVILVGEAGTGKTNIIEGLASMMAADEVPEFFQDKRLVSLSVPSLISGASGAGQLEERLLAILNEVVLSGNIILFIDNIHNLIGVASQGNEGIDLAEVLASEIRKNNIVVIAATTNRNYVESMESSDLGQTLKKIPINEPDKNQTIQIMEAHVGFVEAKNKVYFTYEAIEKIYELANRYILDTTLPKKAIDLMDEVGIMVGQSKSADRLVRAEDVAKLVSKKTSIPLTQVTTQETAKLLNLEEEIHQRIVGQNEAVKYVAAALRRARAELRDKKRPIVNLLFLGPTGVGKTELAKTVAEKYFGDEKNMIRLDMSEYQTQNSLPRLIGSSETSTPGLLTEAVRQKPFALLLLDEIEKAHKEILNIFLQVMDDGRLTDALGRTVDFTNLIIVATSNAGTSYIQDQISQGKNTDDFKDDLIKREIRPIFNPEFINRFDGVIVFKPLNSEEILQITGLMLTGVKKNLETKGIFFEVTDAAKHELAEAGFDPVFGARPLRRIIQERVDNALANFLLSNKIGRRDLIVYDVGGKITVKKPQGY